AGHPALPLETMALPAAMRDEGHLALLGRRSKRGTLAENHAGSQGRRRQSQTQTDHDVPHRGCVHTSTSAGCPDFTASTARLIVAPRSFGSLTGPADHQPMELASLA